MVKSEIMKNKQFTMPDASIILLSVAVIAYLATLFITPGFFNAEQGSNRVELAQYQPVTQSTSAPIFAEGGEIGLANVLFEGLVSGDKYGATIGVMAFILITGGAFGIIMKTGAINNGIMALIHKTQRVEWLFIPLIFLLFSLGGAVFGMGEEAIAFCIVLLPIMKQLGYDAKVTVLTTYVATQIGFATSWMNPFSIAIAQSIAEIPVFSGAGFRMAAWCVFTLFGLVFTVRYANSIRQTKSEQTQSSNQPTLDIADKLILLTFVAGIAWVIWGVMARQYYIPELAAQFFCIGLVSACIASVFKKQSANESADAFKHGAQELLPAALLVALAKGVVLLLGGSDLSTPSTLNTLLYYSASSIAAVPDYVAAWGMLLFQSVFNFFVSSGSGQIVVLAFQLGDGLTNILIPTSASLIGCLGIVKLDWSEWAAFIWRFTAALFALASGFIFLAYFINYQ